MTHAVVAWGRVGIPTEGHQKLVDAVKQHAKQTGGEPMVYLSHTQDPKKNPLAYEDKINYAQKAFGNVVKKSPHKTIIDVMKGLQDKGYKKVTVIAGEDRVPEYHAMLNKYNGRDYNFDKLEVKSAGHRDPDAEGVEGMSASKLRGHAQDSNLIQFRSGLAKNVKGDAAEIMGKVRKGMNLEHLENIHSQATVLACNYDFDSELEFEYQCDRQYHKLIEQMNEAKKEVWDKPNPKEKSTKLTPAQKIKAKARARAAGRSYPNMVDNIWAVNETEKLDEVGPLAALAVRVAGRTLSANTSEDPPMQSAASTDVKSRNYKPTPIIQGRKPKESSLSHYIRTQRELQVQQYVPNTPDNRLTGTDNVRKLFQRMTPGQTPVDVGQDTMVPQDDQINLKRRNAIRRFRHYMEEIHYNEEDDAECECDGNCECNSIEEELVISEAEYQGRKVTLNKPFRTPGGPKKSAVYTTNASGNVVLVRFGDPNMTIKKNIPGRRRNFRARHNCDNPGPRWKARYWSCRAW